ncbi:MAG: STAS domain-containing protein [Oscillospiraceae bacterium]|nr:STAS domain-containing protein [Oscillospiraceae bacterium]
MDIIKSQNGADTALSLKGRLDTVTSPKLQDALTEVLSGSGDVELDFAGIDYVSSAGLRVLLFGQKKSQSSGKSMKLKNVSPEVMEVFEITGFSGMLTIE